MKLVNGTHLEGIEERIQEVVRGYDEVENLKVRVRYTRKKAKTPYSGICYYKEDKIGVSVNPENKYPVKIRIGSPFNKSSWQYYYLDSPEEVVMFVFLHELSHYLDYKNSLSVRCKQTKADKFALEKMGKL